MPNSVKIGDKVKHKEHGLGVVKRWAPLTDRPVVEYKNISLVDVADYSDIVVVE